ncbi:MAG: type I DNA topoisomerase [Candidatus Wildermuthbacteria bacterium]|nr:type I DNA topoisomerase [Candidatus Wildermuthbacteria bacterium]
MKLIIVESPAKARTLESFLGKEYKVLSSFGHIRDLPKGKLGVDTEKNFEPSYVIPTKSKKTVTALKNAAKTTSEVILATDEDREGEAIAWHLSEILGLKDAERIVFHEITKPAIEAALLHPRTVDINQVNAQQARRILDRLVGYKLSPFLWKKVARGLSAGRVQSATVRLIADREEEIQAFKAQEYWSIEALLKKSNNTNTAVQNFTSVLAKKDGKSIEKLEIKNKEEADSILADLKNAEYKVETLQQKETRRNPMPPFTTSTLQQTAGQRLGYQARRTMQIAQQLYEQGLITYHRTDSLNLSATALAAAQTYIEKTFGKEYRPETFRVFKGKAKGAQEAHEAIRPTIADKTPEVANLPLQTAKLYTLIWKRFMASQMNPALFNATSLEISAKEYTFKAGGQMLKFDGFLKVYPMKFEEAELPELTTGEILKLEDLKGSQHFTEPPPRYTEATLIKTLEEYGVGRPSTYAPIISTIQDRGYVEKDERRRLFPTDLGKAVNALLVKHFPSIVDIQFTAGMEERLDNIAEGKQEWVPMLSDFYMPFEKILKEKYEEVSKKDTVKEVEGRTCPKCNSPLLARFGRYGQFYACSAFPACKFTESMQKEKTASLGVQCPKCKKGEIAPRKTKTKRIFYGCTAYPECDFALWKKPTGKTCEQCGSLMVETGRNKDVLHQIQDDGRQSQAITCSNKECLAGKPSPINP